MQAQWKSLDRVETSPGKGRGFETTSSFSQACRLPSPRAWPRPVPEIPHHSSRSRHFSLPARQRALGARPSRGLEHLSGGLGGKLCCRPGWKGRHSSWEEGATVTACRGFSVSGALFGPQPIACERGEGLPSVFLGGRPCGWVVSSDRRGGCGSPAPAVAPRADWQP